MDSAKLVSQARPDSQQLGVLDEAALLPEYRATRAVLDVLPVELRVACLGAERDTELLHTTEPTAEQIARAKLSLTALMTDFRAEARAYPGLHHTLVVHSRRDPNWIHITPIAPDLLTVDSGRERVGCCWWQSGLEVRGIFHARENVARAGDAFGRLAEQASRAVEGIFPGNDQFDPECRWLLELYRTAWKTDEFSATPFFYSLGCEIPVGEYERLRKGQSQSPFERFFERPARALEHPPSCCCCRLSEDCFTASALKIESLLNELNSGSGQWQRGSWFAAVTDGAISVNTLQKARNGKRNWVRARKIGNYLVYEVQSVCRYRPDLRDQILSCLN